MAHMYQNGIGTERNVQKAIKYYSLAADKGGADASFYLGMLYFSNSLLTISYRYRTILRRKDQKSLCYEFSLHNVNCFLEH